MTIKSLIDRIARQTNNDAVDPNKPESEVIPTLDICKAVSVSGGGVTLLFLWHRD